MKFKPIASSSKGNAYLIESDNAAPLLIEAGIPIRKIREAIGFRLSELAGCLVSHSHGDHSKAVKDLLKAGVNCYMSQKTARALKIDLHHRAYYLASQLTAIIGGYRILPFKLEHDVSCFGFIIANKDDRLLFIPDTAYVRNRFQGITIIACECNYVTDILNEKILDGHLPPVVGRRTRRNHMSLETLINMLKANDLSICREIHLMHLSDGNSDEARMIKEVQEATGIATFAA